MSKLNPQSEVFGNEAFERWLGHEGRVLMNEVSTLRKETSEGHPRGSVR